MCKFADVLNSEQVKFDDYETDKSDTCASDREA